MKQDDIDFVSHHYRSGSFSTARGWQRLGLTSDTWWTRIRVAAAITVVVVLSATAAVLYHNHIECTEPTVEAEAPATVIIVVKVLDFEQAPLPTVIDRIEEVYGVELAGVPDNAADYTLSLHYEGTAPDLVATMNEILGTHISVRDK